jgi:protein-L-isoaspartate(D-aspartate) O-methyltransferase
MDPVDALIAELRPSVADQRVLAAIAAVPRERFVAPSEQARAYENVALPIDCGQTISQPLVVAHMLELLELAPSDHVLDVGTGSGYHAALLARLAEHVWTIERHAELTRRAGHVLSELGIDNVTCVTGDGALGLPCQAPFEAINVAAATGPELPAELLTQLADSGRLVAPVGTKHQRLIRVRRVGTEIRRDRLERVRFVPLVRDPPKPPEPNPPGEPGPDGGA